MADKRKKTHSILLSISGKKTSIELFDATLWPAGTGLEGLYRQRIAGVWHSPARAYTFVSPEQVGQRVATMLAGGEISVPPCPQGFESPVRVSVPLEHCEADAPITHTGGWTVTPPHMGPDLRWYVWVNTYNGKRLVACDDIVRG